MVGRFVSPLRLSVSQDKHTHKQARALWTNLPQLLKQTANTMLDSVKCSSPHAGCERLGGEKCDIHSVENGLKDLITT